MHALPMLIVSTLLAGAPATGADLENAVLDFSATWCGPCQQVSPLVARLERAGLPIHKIDVDQNQALAAKYGVSSIPAFLVVINGKVVERQVGVQSEQALREMCRKVTQAKAAQPSRPPGPPRPAARGGGGGGGRG
ncbi:MAG: thioredoxin family protein, partial [Planctomycetaceae bacterium]